MTSSLLQVVAKPVTSARPPAPSRVTHIYWVADAEVARELGVQVRMLCGYWSLLGGSDYEVTSTSCRVDSCRRCVKVLEVAERKGRLIR